MAKAQPSDVKSNSTKKSQTRDEAREKPFTPVPGEVDQTSVGMKSSEVGYASNTTGMPDFYRLEIPKKNVLQRFDQNYVLAAHPFP